jgi:predicted transcriptional regulator
MIEECEDLYPGIDGWFKRKVSPDIEKGKRSAILIYSGEDPVASAVIRKGDQAKLCSMRITPGNQHSWLGHYMMSLVALDLRHQANSIHFTLPESMWEEYGEFFAKYGFICHGEAGHQYRLFDEELACSAPYQSVFQKVLSELHDVLVQMQLPKEKPLPELLMSIKPLFVDRILEGKKTVEIRTEFPVRWKGARVVFYASDPRQELAGEGVIEDVTIDTPTNIWERFGLSIGCTRDEYLGYCGPHLRVSALKFKDVIPYLNRVPRSQLEVLMDEDLRPPVSYARVLKNRGWLTAISLSKVLRTSI